jgi:hypothetical protein
MTQLYQISQLFFCNPRRNGYFALFAFSSNHDLPAAFLEPNLVQKLPSIHPPLTQCKNANLVQVQKPLLRRGVFAPICTKVQIGADCT